MNMELAKELEKILSCEDGEKFLKKYKRELARDVGEDDLPMEKDDLIDALLANEDIEWMLVDEAPNLFDEATRNRLIEIEEEW